MSEAYTIEEYDVSSSVPDKSQPNGKRTVDLEKAKAPKFVPTEAGFQAAVQYYQGEAGGIAYVMDRLNTQIATDSRNAIRSAFAKSMKGPDEAVLFKKAMAEIFTNTNLTARATAMAGDMERIQNELAGPIIARLKAEYAQQAAASLPPVTEEPTT